MSQLSLLNGPVWLPPHVTAAMAGPMCDLRHPRFRDAYARCQSGVRALLHAPDHAVVLAAGSGSFGVELVLRNVIAENDAVLAVVAGTYGERMARMAELAGARVTAPLGCVTSASQLAGALAANGPFAYVLLVHVEPSTGTELDLPALASACRDAGAIPLVDGICSAFALRTDCAADHLGAVVTASQKGLSLPPGMAVALVRHDLVERARATPESRTGVYGRLASWVAPSFVFTPPMAHVFALDASLAHIARETIEVRDERHTAAARRVHAWARARGLTAVADPQAAARTLTALYYPEGANDAWLRDVRDRRGLELAPANHPQLIDRSFRIGHLGDLPADHLDRGLAVLDSALEEPR